MRHHEWLDIHGLKSKKITRLANTAAGHAKLITQLPETAHGRAGGHRRL